jgi:hypothetical protein
MTRRKFSEPINNPTGPLCGDKYIQMSLRKKLGRDYDVFLGNLAELSSLLQTLCGKLNINPLSPVAVWRFRVILSSTCVSD